MKGPLELVMRVKIEQCCSVRATIGLFLRETIWPGIHDPWRAKNDPSA